MPPQSSAEAGSWPPSLHATLDAPGRRSGPQWTSTQSTAYTTHHNSRSKLLRESTARHKPERIVSGYCNLLESTTDVKFRQVIELTGLALRGRITEILRGKSATPQATAPALAASGKNTKLCPVPAIEPRKKTIASGVCTVQILAGENTRPGAATLWVPIAAPIPTQGRDLTSNQTSERSCTEVVRKKIKPVTSAASKAITGRTPSAKPKAPAKMPENPDERVFLRLRPDHQWGCISPHFIKISLANSSIRKVIIVKSGFVLQANGEGARSALLTGAAILDSSEMKLEAVSNWISVLAPNIPDGLYTLEGPVPVIPEMVIEEETLKTGVRPTSARAFATSMARPSTNWVLHFATGKPKLGERLFEESSRLHELQRKPKIARCN